MSANGANDEKEKPHEEAVRKLTNGLIALFLPPLVSVKQQLVELTRKQESICRQLHQENLQLCQESCDPELKAMFAKITLYREKLVALKNRMIVLHDKSNKLKKRALKLEHTKQNEAKARMQQREREEQLIGRHAD